jgi:diguanylate cyclase (GGDEF)-like protein/PAS domain S-box-containing protein
MNEKSIHASRAYPEIYPYLFNQTSDMVILLSVEDHMTFRYILVNDKALSLLRWSENIYGKTLNEVLPKDKVDIVLERYKKVLDSKTSLSYKEQIRLKDGHAVGEAMLTPLFDDANNCTHILTVVRDITEQTIKEEELEITQNFFEAFLEHSGDPISLWSVKGEALKINPAFEKVFGWQKEEFIGKMTIQTNEIVPEHKKEEAAYFFRQMLQGETISYYQTQRKHKDGTLIDVSITCLPIKDKEGRRVTAAAVGFRDISKNRKLQDQLKEAKEQLELVWDNTADGIYMFTLEGRLLHINPAFTSLFGWTKKDTKGAKPAIMFTPPHLKEEIQEIRSQLRKGESIVGLETQRRKIDGSFLDVLATYNPIKNESGEVWAAVGVYKDITKQKQIQAKLMESEERYRLIAQHSHDMIKVLNTEGLITYASPSHEKVLGFEPAELVGKTFFDTIHKDDVLRVKEKFSRSVAANSICKSQFRQYSKDGTWIWMEVVATPIVNKEGRAQQYTLTARDITQRKQYEEELTNYASRDSLTGLYNRRIFTELIDNAVKDAKRYRRSFAVMYLDIDKFKSINDSLGHEMGDELLKQFAERLKVATWKRDTLARMGGDEFTILLSDIDGLNGVVEAAERIHQALQVPYDIQGQTFLATASIGIALYPDHGEKTKILVRHADEALYKAKESRNSYSIYGFGAKII